MKPAFILLFLICPPEGAMCEEGFVVHRTCALAENFVRWGMREGQSLHITECVAESEWMKRKREQ
jgi:hypothetical protein